MRGYLIDTNVISEYNREQLPHAGVVKWLDTTPEASQYVSVLTLAEIEKGILRKEEGKRRPDLQLLVRRRPSGAVCGAHSCLRCTGSVMLGSSDRIAAR
jgi:predicted nucleic acid-binding protein